MSLAFHRQWLEDIVFHFFLTHEWKSTTLIITECNIAVNQNTSFTPWPNCEVGNIQYCFYSVHHSFLIPSVHRSFFPPVHLYCTHTVGKALSPDFPLFILFLADLSHLYPTPMFPNPTLFPPLLAVSENELSPIITSLHFNLPYLINELCFHNIAQLIWVQLCLLPNN